MDVEGNIVFLIGNIGKKATTGNQGPWGSLVAAALFVAGIVATAPSLAPATSAAMQAEYSNAVYSHYENGLGFVCRVLLILDGINRSGCCGNA
jgi:hypothetical protein